MYSIVNSLKYVGFKSGLSTLIQLLGWAALEWERTHTSLGQVELDFFRGASDPSSVPSGLSFALCNISYVTDTNESWCLAGHLWLTSALTWHLLCCSPLLSFSEVRSPKCRAGTAAAGCSCCRTDWTSAGASGWLSPLSQGEAWRCTSYYSRSSRPARTAHKRRKQEKVTGQTKYEGVFFGSN